MRVLHLEDDALDAQIVGELFKAEFPASEVTVVTSRFAFLGELELRPFDVIVSDYTLDTFDGFEALKLARVRAPHVPFVFYSGTIGEERALEAIQHGALDYVPKGEVRWLSVAVRRALAQSEERRRRRETEAHNRVLAEALNRARDAQRQLEEKIESIPRLENVGVLAAGVAHDLNNLLAPVLLAVPMLRESTPDADSRRLLATLERSAQRGAALVGQIMAMVHGGNDEPSRVRLDELAGSTLKFVRESYPKNILVAEAFAREPWLVTAIPAQISQVLLNLCRNARSAMPQGGTLTVSVDNTELDESEAKAIRDGRAGRFVVLRVDDTGPGTNPADLQRRWDPRAVDGDETAETDLGLLAVRNIVKRHGGFVQVLTAAGFGSSFRVYLPAVA